ncbi:hypothetical protein [Yinghuangia sp. YIM S09857]|uniref:hypothetical protein n=1 Tax=Yinghuangia sp. YIM S09857 TaxID=3436929 RepID=UPI003F535ED8
MLHLTDTPTGHPQPAAPPGTRRLRVAYCPASLRAALTADVLRRAAERHHMVVTLHRHTCDRPELPDPLRYNIHPPTPEAPDAPVDVHITPEGHTDSDVTARILRTVPQDPAPESPEANSWADADPLALRLALLTSPSDPTPDAEHLALLRKDVARFAESPSAAMAAPEVAQFHAAIDNDLDTRQAVALANALHTNEALSPGTRFESLIHLDRTLGLDLARQIGQLP